MKSPDPNLTLATAKAVDFIRSVPGSVPGTIATLADADLFKLSLIKGDSADIAIDTLSVGSSLDNRLRIFDAAGNELATNHVPGATPV